MQSQEKWIMYDQSKGFAPGKVYGTFVDSKGQPWFGTSGGISVFENGKFTTWLRGKDGLNEFKDSYGYKQFDEKKNGIIMVSNEWVPIRQINKRIDPENEYYCKFGHNEFENDVWKYYSCVFENPPYDANMAFRDNLDQIWLVSKPNGLKIYDTNYKPIDELNNSAPKPPYTCILADLEGVWVATKKEMYRFENQKKAWVSYAHVKSLENAQDIYPFNDMVLFANYKEVTLLKNGEFKVFGKEHKLTGVGCIGHYNDEAKNETWIISKSGLLHYKDHELKKTEYTSTFNQTKKYGSGFVAATDKTLLYYNGKQFQFFRSPMIAMSCLLEEIDGKMWFSSGHYSLCIDGDQGKEFRPEVYKKIPMPGLFLDNHLLGTKSNGDIFFYFKSVTREFNWIFKFNKNEEWSRIEIPNKNKFIALRIKDAIKDKNENFVVSTAVGLFKFNGEELELLIPWDNGARGNQLEKFIGDKWLVCSNEGVIYFPEGAFSLIK
jgi:ligand-binding sensor domain-containing protein